MSRYNDRDRIAKLSGSPAWCSMAVTAPSGAVWNWLGIGRFEAGQLLDVSITRGRGSEKDQAEPASMSFTLVGDLTIPTYGGPVEVGQVLTFQVAAPFLTAFGGFNVVSQERFWGIVTDLGERVLDPTTGLALTPVICSSHKARLPNNSFGRLPWPAGTSDIDILIDTLAAAYDADKTFAISSWNTAATKANWYAPAAARVAVSTSDRFRDWDVDNQTHAQVISDLEVSADAVLAERRNGQLDWLNPPTRVALKAAGPSITLGAADLISGATVAQRIAAIVNKFSTSWGDGTTTIPEVASDDNSIRFRGNLTDTADTRLLTAAAAQRYSRAKVTRYAVPKWMMTAASVDLVALVEQGRGSVAAALLKAELGALVRISGIPAPSPVSTGLFWLEGWTEKWTSGRVTMDLSLVPYEFLAAGTRWQDTPATLNWNSVPFDLTWDHALTWAP